MVVPVTMQGVEMNIHDEGHANIVMKAMPTLTEVPRHVLARFIGEQELSATARESLQGHDIGGPLAMH